MRSLYFGHYLQSYIPIAGDNFEVISTPTVTDQEQQQNIAESRQFVNTPSIPNVVFNNQAIFNATKDLPEGNQTQIQFKKDIVNTLKDYAKDNDLAGALNQFQIEAADGDKRGETIVNNIIKASNVNPATYSAAVFNQAGDKVSTASLDGTVKLWDIQTKECTKIFKLEEEGYHNFVCTVMNAFQVIRKK